MNIKDVFNNKNICIMLFLVICIVKLLYSTFYFGESTSQMAIRIVSLSIYLLLSYYAYKEILVASIIIAIVILLTGLGMLALAFIASKNQFVLRLTSLFIGVYFAYGGIRMLLSSRGQRKSP
jgi:hypothetical protein